MKVLVAGATGAVGRHVVRQLLTAGHSVRALSRNLRALAGLGSHELHAADLTQPDQLNGACAGIDAVIACAGASLQIGAFSQRAGFLAVDYEGNRNLLAEARRAGVSRFIYISLAGATAVPNSEYAQAHERFAVELAGCGTAFTIIRSTGFFSAFAGLLPLARAGIVPLVGAGLARTNPIHEADVAQACVEALSGREESHTIGGPEIFTRHRLAEMAFDAISKPPRLLSLPSALLLAAVPLCRPIHPRLAALVHFALLGTQVDMVAPIYGARRLGDYLRCATAGGAAPL